jgi:hypothetical protein
VAVAGGGGCWRDRAATATADGHGHTRPLHSTQHTAHSRARNPEPGFRPKTLHPDQPAAHTAFQIHRARLVRNMGRRSPHLRVLGAQAFSPLLKPYSPGGAARGSHTGQFSCFGPRSCFIAPVLDSPNGFWPLNKAVGRAYIRATVPSSRDQHLPSLFCTLLHRCILLLLSAMWDVCGSQLLLTRPPTNCQ